MDSLPDVVSHTIAPNTTEEIIEFRVFSRKSFDLVNIHRTVMSKEVFKRAGSKKRNRLVGHISRINILDESPEQIGRFFVDIHPFCKDIIHPPDLVVLVRELGMLCSDPGFRKFV